MTEIPLRTRSRIGLRALTLLLLGAALSLLGACGRIDYDGACVASFGSAPFSAPTPLTSSDPRGEDLGPTFSASGLRLYFVRIGMGTSVVHVVERPSLDAPFDAPTPLEPPPPFEGAPTSFCESDVGGRYYAATVNAAGTDSDLYELEREGGAWRISPIAELNTPADEWDPFASWVDGRLYFIRYDGSDSRMFVAERLADGTFAAPIALDGLDTSGTGGNPTVTADGSLLVFNRGRDDASSLHYARLVSPTTFGEVAPIAGTDLPGGEREPAVSPNGCEVVFQNDYRLYRTVMRGR
jgi:Tol biopolymer transport system component